MKMTKIFSKKQKNEPAKKPETKPVETGNNDKPEEITKSKPRKKRKHNKTIARMCIVCMNPFMASRRDACFCSGACREFGSLHGADYGKSKNIAEHILIRELKYRFEYILENEGASLNKSELYSWIEQSEVVKRLLFPFIDQKSYYVQLYYNILDSFYYQLKKEVKNLNKGPFDYTIGSDDKTEMRKFLKMFNSSLTSDPEPEMIN